jgi:hypothetical protein
MQPQPAPPKEGRWLMLSHNRVEEANEFHGSAPYYYY